MARPETEIRRIIQNMDRMGWTIRQTGNSSGVVVTAPGHAPVTINARAAGHGDGMRNALSAIARTGYETAWADYLDRQRDQRIAAATPEPPSPATVFGDKPMTSTAAASDTTAQPVNRDLVDGVKVTDRTTAKLATPLTNGEAREVAGVDEIMLEDGRVLYQCVRSAFCAKTYDTPLSARAHLTAHGTVRRAAKADKARRIAEDSRAVKSMASQIGHEVRRQRVALLVGDETRAAWLTELASQMEAAAPMLRELARHKIEVPTLIGEDELAELRAKAAKWDAFLEMTRS